MNTKKKREFSGKFLWFRDRSQGYEDLLAAINGALEKGYSVLQIARLLATNTRGLYNVLRREGLFCAFPVGRPPALPCSLPEALQEALQTAGMGFYQWCQGRRPALDPSQAAVGLTEQYPGAYPAGHMALWRDFPNAYTKIFGEDLDVDRSTGAREEDDFCMKVSCSGSNYLFVAEDPRDPSLRCASKSIAAAAVRFQGIYRHDRSLRRLNALPDRAVVAVSVTVD